MDAIVAAASVLAGLLLRLAIPLAFTGAAVWLLRRLDAHWQMEAEKSRGLTPMVPVVRCWELRQCPPDKLASCPAYLDQSQPCWQHFRDESGNLQERCLACELFQNAAVPESSRPRVLP